MSINAQGEFEAELIGVAYQFRRSGQRCSLRVLRIDAQLAASTLSVSGKRIRQA
jgi:hypothetical protein